MFKVVVDISESYYELLQEVPDENLTFAECVLKYGTVLSKSHGRLVDGDKMLRRLEDWRKTNRFTRERILEAPTIIEADKEKR